MSAYIAILKCRLATLFQYRAAALAGLCTQIFWGIIRMMIFIAFYKGASSKEPLSLEQALTFIWLGQALLQLIPWNIDKEIEEQIHNGNVVYELIRPLDLYWLWYSRAMAMRLFPTLLRCIPLFILAGLFFQLSAPVSGPALLAFIVSLGFAVLLSSAITTLVVISLFWTISGEGIQRLLPHAAMLLSGLIVPLPLFPDWMQPLLSIQPFRCIIDIPSRLYTGIIPAHEAIYYLVLQLLWTLIIIYYGKKLMKRALRKLVIQGG